ncbi:unnamed protein product [Vitrella brassicaformis CCMP3155]|uniref:Uncharacterized protein n=1 Tax=Vitrella brassicaformis (strain CCMP3155) TaxID=1169540 RepID=A0A0G4F3S5_VITBC|nr:unnamed protein product [Vitrella brassicaformis CCMP3155]|eukprot:CEM06648.1 unnamed protein product [Vitrella brassicaformis CCMP3155]
MKGDVRFHLKLLFASLVTLGFVAYAAVLAGFFFVIQNEVIRESETALEKQMESSSDWVLGEALLSFSSEIEQGVRGLLQPSMRAIQENFRAGSLSFGPTQPYADHLVADLRPPLSGVNDFDDPWLPPRRHQDATISLGAASIYFHGYRKDGSNVYSILSGNSFIVSRTWAIDLLARVPWEAHPLFLDAYVATDQDMIRYTTARSGQGTVQHTNPYNETFSKTWMITLNQGFYQLGSFPSLYPEFIGVAASHMYIASLKSLVEKIKARGGEAHLYNLPLYNIGNSGAYVEGGYVIASPQFALDRPTPLRVTDLSFEGSSFQIQPSSDLLQAEHWESSTRGTSGLIKDSNKEVFIFYKKPGRESMGYGETSDGTSWSGVNGRYGMMLAIPANALYDPIDGQKEDILSSVLIIYFVSLIVAIVFCVGIVLLYIPLAKRIAVPLEYVANEAEKITNNLGGDLFRGVNLSEAVDASFTVLEVTVLRGRFRHMLMLIKQKRQQAQHGPTTLPNAFIYHGGKYPWMAASSAGDSAETAADKYYPDQLLRLEHLMSEAQQKSAPPPYAAAGGPTVITIQEGGGQTSIAVTQQQHAQPPATAPPPPSAQQQPAVQQGVPQGNVVAPSAPDAPAADVQSPSVPFYAGIRRHWWKRMWVQLVLFLALPLLVVGVCIAVIGFLWYQTTALSWIDPLKSVMIDETVKTLEGITEDRAQSTANMINVAVGALLQTKLSSERFLSENTINETDFSVTLGTDLMVSYLSGVTSYIEPKAYYPTPYTGNTRLRILSAGSMSTSGSRLTNSAGGTVPAYTDSSVVFFRSQPFPLHPIIDWRIDITSHMDTIFKSIYHSAPINAVFLALQATTAAPLQLFRYYPYYDTFQGLADRSMTCYDGSQENGYRPECFSWYRRAVASSGQVVFNPAEYDQIQQQQSVILSASIHH